jgi:beta-glucanase (GH16 family)
MPTSATPSFSDSFTSLSLHQTWQSGDKWSLIAPDTPSGRGGPIYNENGDQWWTNPYNTNTPISGLYTLAAGGGLQLGLLPTPAADQAYINSEAGASMPYVGALLNTYPSSYQKYGLWDITAAVPATPGTSFQADTENVQITGTWPPEIDLRISTDSSGTETVLYDVQTTSGVQTWTTSSAAGFNAALSHTYGWDWESNYITFFIDGKQVWQVATPQDGSYTTNPMFLFLLTGANYRQW